MNIIKRLMLTFLTVVLFILSYSVVSYADNAVKSEIYKDPYGQTLCASRKGYWREAPENSIKAINLAVEKGADIVEIDVKKTSDGVLILMSDDTVVRTCKGYTGETEVSKLTYAVISEFTLLEGEGGTLAKPTDEKVPTLEDVFKSDADCLYLIDADESLKDDIYFLAQKCDMLDSVIFFFSNMKPSELTSWKSSLPTEPLTMTYFKGNVIFSAVSSVKKAAETSEAVLLATKVSAGVVYGSTVMNSAAGKVRTAAIPAVPELCGTIREDTEVWWDDLIGRGYSIIITDYVPELRAYIDGCNDRREELRDLYTELVDNWQLPDLKSDKYLDYKLAYNNAVAMSTELLRDGSSSRSDLNTAIYELQKAYDDIVNNYESLKNGTAGKTLSPLRIVICIVAVAVVTAAEIFVYKKKKRVSK